MHAYIHTCEHGHTHSHTHMYKCIWDKEGTTNASKGGKQSTVLPAMMTMNNNNDQHVAINLSQCQMYFPEVNNRCLIKIKICSTTEKIC